MIRRDGLSHHFKTMRLFLLSEVDEKTAQQKPKKVKISATFSQFFLITHELQKLSNCGFHEST